MKDSKLQLSFFSLAILFITLVPLANTAKILALVVTPSPSHHIWNRALMLELASRGHEVTVVSPDPEKEKIPNHTDIFINGMYEEVLENFDYEAMSLETGLQNFITVFKWGQNSCKKGLNSSGARKLKEMAQQTVFDLIIIEAAIDECFHGFIPLFGSPPVIAITAYSNPPWTASWTGNPNNPAYISDCNLPYSDEMTLLQRTANFLHRSFVLAYRRFYHMPKQEEIARAFFGPAMPPLADIEKNISLVLVNIHYSIDYPRPFMPSVIPVGGMHIKPTPNLPKELELFLDNSTEGVILFSLGTNVRSDKLKEDKVKMFIDAFSQLPEKILWKWESDITPQHSKNVYFHKWLPQGAILAHPNTRLFITHSGLLSSQEAVYYGVPIVGLPFFADQYINLQKNINHGVAENLDYHSLTTENILQTVQKVLYNNKYKENMKKLSKQFRDRPKTALNDAIWWIEYVIRHQGAPHLQSFAKELVWYQYYLLDVLMLITTILLSPFIVLNLIYIIKIKTSKNNKVGKLKVK